MKKLLTCLTILIAFTLAPGLSKAQLNLEDVVYLKNGSILHGIIIEEVPGQSLKIQTHDGNVFAFKLEEIEKLTKEPRKHISGYSDAEGKGTHFVNFTELDLGLGIGQMGYGVNWGIRTVKGFQINPYFSTGIGTGFYLEEGSFYIPLYADFRVNFTTNPFAPFCLTDIGYTFSIDNSSNNGIFINPAIGIRFPVLSTSMQISAGYRYQNAERTYYYFAPWNDYEDQTVQDAITIKVGFVF